MARVLYCKGARFDPDNQDVLQEWPKGWSDVNRLLADVDYTDAKEYFICLNDAHPCHWDILESRDVEWQHCGEKVNSLLVFGSENKGETLDIRLVYVPENTCTLGRKKKR